MDKGRERRTTMSTELLISQYKAFQSWTSSHDGGLGRHDLPPHTTTERITTKSQNK